MREPTTAELVERLRADGPPDYLCTDYDCDWCPGRHLEWLAAAKIVELETDLNQERERQGSMLDALMAEFGADAVLEIARKFA